jgi:hypothetical protein
LTEGGRLDGRVVDAAGQPTATQVVILDRSGQTVATTVSDEAGSFAFLGLAAGSYHIATMGAAVPCRCWAHGTAPPVATNRVLLVEDPTLARGQRPIGELLFCPPVLWSLIIAAAIIIPIAVHNSQDAS